MKHTPGPWIRSIHPGHHSNKDADEQIANACLIAAAPELLKAVRTLLELVPHFPEGGVCAKQVDAICQLVAKVQGGAK